MPSYRVKINTKTIMHYKSSSLIHAQLTVLKQAEAMLRLHLRGELSGPQRWNAD